MKKSNVTTPKIQAPAGLFTDTHAGMQGFKALKHKNNKPFSDLEYMELLAAHADELEKNGQPNFYDRTALAVAREIKRGRADGMTTAQLNRYLQQCVDINA